MTCRVEAETNAHYNSIDATDRKFSEFRAERLDDTKAAILDAHNHYERISDILVDRAWQMIKAGKPSDGDLQMVIQAINLACTVHYQAYRDEIADARQSFVDALEKCEAIDDWVEQEIDHQFDNRHPLDD